MSNPVTGGLAGVGIISNLFGAITQAQGAQYQGAAQAAMYNYQAGVARANASIAASDATYAREAGETEAQESGMQTAQIVGKQRAGYGAGNIDVNTGSAAAVQASQEAVGSFEQQVIRSNAAKNAFGFEVKGAQDTAQAGAYDSAAQTSRVAAQFGVTSSIIGGASGVSSRWLQATQQGIFPGGGKLTDNSGFSLGLPSNSNVSAGMGGWGNLSIG